MLTPNEVTDEDTSVPTGAPEGKTPWPAEEDTAKWVNDRKSKAEQHLSDWYDEAKTAYNFYENKQWEESDEAKLKEEGRVAPVFNRVAATVHAICGQEVSNRQEVRYLPRRVGEVSIADPMNDAVKWIRDGCNAEDEDSDAFKDMVICGMGWTVSRMDYEENPDGQAMVDRRDPMLMRWDPAARKKNLADKKWVQGDYWMSKEDIEDRWPDADVTGLITTQSSPNRSNPVDVSEAWKYNKNATGKDQYNDQWRVIHHVERFTKTVHRMVDPSSGQLKTYEADHFAAIQAVAKAQGVPIQSNPVKVRVFWEAWVVGGVVLACNETKIQKDFPYQAMTCFRERETGYWFGLVCFMLDPQRYANRMASLLMTILGSGAKGGIIFETGAFANPQKAKKDWADPTKAVEVNPGKMASVQPRQGVQLPAGVTDFMTFAISSIRDVTGVNIEMLGLREGDQPGIVESMRTKAGLTILAGVFDAIRLYRKRQGIVLAEFVQKFLSDGRLIRIFGDAGQQYVPLIHKGDIEYDTVVDESPASRDVKEKTWMVLQQIVPGMTQMGVQIPPSVMDYLPLPESLGMDFKKALLQKMSQPQQPPPELMIEQMKGEVQKHVAEVKAQQAALSEESRVRADVTIAHAQAQLKAETERARDAFQMQLEAFRAEKEQHTALLTTIISQIGKVAAAEVSASKDTDQEARQFTNPQAYPQ